MAASNSQRLIASQLPRVIAAAVAMLCVAVTSRHAAFAETKTWTAGGISVTWDDAGNWDPSGVPTADVDAILPFAIPVGYGTLTLGPTSTAGSVRFQNNYTLSGGVLTTSQLYAEVGTYSVIESVLSGTGGLMKAGGGSIRLANADNDYTGITTIANGELVISSAGALGADSSAISITESNPVPASTAVIGYPGGSLVLDGNPGGFTLSRDIDVVGIGPGGRSGAITSVGNNTLAGIVTTASTSLPSTFRNTRIIPANGTLTFSGTLNALGTAGTTLTTLGGLNSAGVGNSVISGALGGTGTLEKTGAGTLFLSPASAAGFSGRFRISASGTVGQSSVRITSGTAADGTNIFGTANSTGGNAPIDMGGGVLEIRSDDSIDFARNVYQRSSSTFFAAPSATGAAINGTMTFGELSLQANMTATFTSRNGYGFTFANSTQNTTNEQNTITNNMGGTLRFNGNVWGNNDADPRALTINGSGNTFIGGSITSSGAGVKTLNKGSASLLTIAGVGTTLSGTGPVNVNAGAIMVTDFRSLQNNAGTINLGNSTNAGSLIFGVTGVNATAAGLTGTNKVINLNGTTGGAGLYASQAGANPVLIQANLTATGAGAKTLTLGGTNSAANLISGVIPNSSSATSLLKVGPGTWVLSGTNTYTGATTISNGLLRLRSNSAGAGVLPDTNAITFNATNGYAGGTLDYQWVSGGTTSETLGALTPTAGANTIRLTPGSGTASLVFASLGTVNNTATLNIDGADATTNTVTITALTTGTLVSPRVYFGGGDFAFVTTGGLLRAPVYGTDTGFVNATGSSALPAGTNINYRITGDITAQGTQTVSTLKFDGSHTLTVGPSNTLTVRTGAANTPGGILVTGGTSTITGGIVQTAGTQPLAIRVNGTTDQLNYASRISAGSGGLTKSGLGTLVISGSNNQTGQFTINEGTVRLATGGVLSGANVAYVIRQNATLDLGGVGTGSAIGEFTNVGTVTNSAATAATLTIGNNNATGTSYGVMQDGAGVLNVSKVGTGGQSWLGLSTYTGTTTIGSSGLVTVDMLSDIGVASGIGAGNATSDATNAASLVFDGSTGGLVYAGVLRPLGSGDPGLALGSTSASTNRLFTLSGTADGSGATLSSSVTNGNAIIWSNTAPIAFGPSAAAQTLILRGASTGDNTFNPQLTDNGDNATRLTKTDAGQWNLGNTNNTFTGITTISNGILALNTPGALPASSPLDLGTTTTSGILQTSGTFSRSVASSSTPGTGSVRWNGTTGGGGFAAHGSKLVVALGGVETPTALTWGTNGFVPTGAPLLLNSTSALDEVVFRNAIDLGTDLRTINVADNTSTGADFATVSGVLSGAGGGISKAGAGTLQLTGANSYSGTTAVTAGMLVVSSLGSSTSMANAPTSVGVSGVTMTDSNAVTIGNGGTGGATLVYTGSGETSDRKIRLNTTTGSPQIHANGSGPLILTNVANDMAAGAKTLFLRGSNGGGNMITGTLADNGVLSVTADGAAIWILTGSNSYTGNTTSGGAGLGLGHDSAVGTGVLVLSNGSIFAYGGDRTIGNRLRLGNNAASGIFGDYGFVFTDPAEMNASNANVATNNNLVAGKQLRLAGGVVANSLGNTNRTWTIDGSGETFIDGNFTTDATAAGVVLTKTGNGTLILGGTANNFSKNGAALNLTRGTLRMAANNAIPSGAGFGSMTINPTAAVSGTATFDLAGTSQTINGLTATSDGTTIIDNSSASAAALTFGANNAAVSFGAGTGSYAIRNTGGGPLSIFKTGTTAATFISGITLEHTGTTGVTGGSFTIASPLSGTGGGLFVSGSGSLLALTGGITNPGLITNVSVGAGSTLNLLDGVGSAMTNLSALALGSAASGTTTLNFNVGTGATDTLGLLGGGSLSLFGGTTGKVLFNLTDAGLEQNTSYTLLSSADGGFTLGSLTAADYLLGGTPGGFETFTLTANDEAVFVTTGNLITGDLFWREATDTAWNGNVDNWSTDKAGSIPASSIPGQGTDVIFAWDGASGAVATTLEQNFKINSLTFEPGSTTPSSVTIAPGTVATNRLEIAPQVATDGIAITAGGPTAVTISAPVKLGADQTWSIADAGATLTLSGPLFGEAAVTKTGSGSVVLAAAADPTFNSGTTTTLAFTTGTLVFNDTGALGTPANANVAPISLTDAVFYVDTAAAGVTANPLTLAGSTLSAAGAAQTYSGLVTIAAPSTIMMRNANSADPTAAARNITLSGGLAGNGTLIVDGNNTAATGNEITGTLTLNQDNTAFTGSWDIRRGTISTNNAAGLGAGSLISFEKGRVTLAAGAGNVTLGRNVTVASATSTSVGELSVVATVTLDVTGTTTLGGTGGFGELRVWMAADTGAVISGPVVLANNGGLGTQNAATRLLTVSGRITETGGARSLTINDAGWGGTAGIVLLTNSNAYSGGTTLARGTLRLGNDSAIGTGPVTFGGGALEAWGASRTVSNPVTLTGNGSVVGSQGLTLSGPVVGTAGNSGRSLTNELTSGTLEISGPLSLGAAANTAARSLTVSGAGATMFSGTVSNGNSYANALIKSGLGRLTISGSYGATGSVGVTGGELLLAGGSLNNGSAGTVIGNAASARGILRVNGGRYATNDISVGANATGMGTLIIQGGEVTTTSTTTSTGAAFANTAGGYGGFVMSSGTFATNRFDMGVNNGGTTVAQITGGRFNWTEYLLVRSNRGELTFGGTVDAARTGVGNTFAIEASAATGGVSVVTIGGGSVSNAGQNVQFGRASMSAPSTVMLNVNAGTLITNSFTVNPANFTAGYVNFGGGTLRANVASATFLPVGLTGVYVNGPFGSNAGGAVFDTNSQNITVAANLIAPTGSGVTTIPVTAGGSGYLGAPFVEISGGGGFGASASANVDLDPASPTYGQLLSISVTNPGNAYTSEPVITLVGGGGSGVTLGTPTLTANTSGGLTKLNTGTLTLTGENTYTGPTTISAGALSIGSGGAAGSILGNVTNNATLIFNRSDAVTYSGSVGGSGAVIKAGAGTLTLSATQGYAGLTQVHNGTLRLVATNSLPTSGTLQLGNASTGGRFELDGADQAFTALTVVSTAASATNGLVIPTGRTLTVNGEVMIGTNANNTTTNFATSGGGAFAVSSGGANFALGGATGGTNENAVSADFSSLSSFSAALGSGTLRLGDANTAIGGNATNFLLATSNTITAAAISVGASSGGNSLHTLTLGSGVNTLNATTLDIGMAGTANNRSNGLVQFAVSDTTGSVRIRGSDGSSRTTMRMVDTTSATINDLSGTLALAGHEADIFAGGFSMAVRSGSSGNATALLSFDRGTLDITTLTMGQRTGAGTGNADATVTLGGGTSTIGSLAMAVNTSAGGTSTGTFSVSGGSVAIGLGSGNAINMATAAASRTATSALNLTGGSLTLAGNIVRSGSAGTESATITLDGGALDLGGFSIGSGAAPISLVALSGNLSNLGEFNGGSLFTKTGLGTLTLSGSSGYSGGTTLSSGTLFAGSANAFGSGAITIAAAGTLDLNNFSVANTITNVGGTVLNAGSYAGTQTVTTGTATLEGGVGGTLDIASGAVADIVGEVATSGTVVVNGGGRGRAQGAVRGRVSIEAAGEFELVNGGSVDAGATIQNAGRFRVDRSDLLEIAAAISGTGSFQKAGAGRLVLSGQNTYTGLTEVLAGQLKVNGRVAGGLTVAQGAEVGGSGSIGGVLTGDGLIAPGNSPGIFAAAQLLPTETTSFALEFSGTGSPNWGNASASINDVLRFTDPTTPIAGSLAASNVINIYFDVASLAVGDTFLGGFFTDKQTDFYGLIENATYQFFIKGDGQGGTLYNSVSYYSLNSWAATNLSGFTGVGRSTVQATANFAGGEPVNGQVTQFVIVPEPGTAVAAGIGIGILAWALRRRKAGARG